MRKLLSFIFLFTLSFSLSHAGQPLNKIAAVVNGEMITYYDLMANAAPIMLREGIDPKQPANAKKIQLIEQNVLESMIMDIVIAQEAQRLNLGVSKAEIDREVAAARERMQLSEADFARQLEAQGMDMASVRERMGKNIIRNKLLSNMVARKVVVTDEEVEAFFASNNGKIPLEPDGSVHFALIIYPPNVDAKPLSQKLISGALDFAKTAQEVSIGPNPEKGGDLGAIPWQNVAPAVREQLETLETGQVSPLFTLEKFQAQVKRVSSTEAQEQAKTELDEQTRAQIENVLREQKQQERYKEYTEQLRERARIDVRL